MSETKSVVRYDNNYLQKYCKENCIELLKDYSKEKVNRDSIINAKCLMENCNDFCIKNYRQFIKTGSYCKLCAVYKKKERMKNTFQNNYSAENPNQNTEIRQKVKNTCLEKYGVENPFQNEVIKEKIKETNLKKYGVENPNQNTEIRQKTKSTCLEKYGVENPNQNTEIRQKTKNTCLEKYGVDCYLQQEEVKEKIKQNNFDKYGVKHNSQTQQFKDKFKNTCLEKYGVEHISQNAKIAEKMSNNAYKSKDYIFPSGRIERIQGYEHYMLSELLQQENILEDDIIVSRKEVPSVWYEDKNGKKRRYFVDCFIKSQNRCIETKSTWSASKAKDSDCIFLKQQALKDAGYECEIWIYNSKGEKVECYK